MKRACITAVFIPVFLALLFLLGSCVDMLNPPAGVGPVPSGKGRLAVQVAGAARTALPAGSFDRYVLSFEYTGGTEGYTHASVEWAGGVTVDLEPGNWTVHADAYSGETVAGTGIAAVTISPGSVTPVNIVITAIKTGTGIRGTLKYTVNYPPTDANHAYGNQTLNIVSPDGTSVGSPITITGGKAGTVEVAAGVYFVTALVENTVQRTVAARTVSAHIYGGQETVLVIDIEAGDFTAAIPVTGTVNVTVPAGLTVASCEVKAYSDSACTNLAGTSGLLSTSGFTVWVSSTLGTVYLRQEMEVEDGGGRPLVLSGNKQAVTIPANMAEAFACGLLSDTFYGITVVSGISNGTVTAYPFAALSGTEITLTVEQDSDSVLKGGTLKYNGTAITSGPPYTFTMPASDVTVSAEFERLYSVTVGSFTGGTVKAGGQELPVSAVAGTTITLAVTPDSGYVLKDGTFKYNDGSDHVIAGPPYTFTMPASNVTVSAEFIQFVRYVTQDGAGTKDGTSWENASDDLQKMMDALAAIPSSDYTGIRVVKVAAGTYKPQYKPKADGTTDDTTTAGDRDSAFILREGVQVWGGYDADGDIIDETARKQRFNADGTVISPSYQAILSGDFTGDDSVTGSGSSLSITGNGENAYHVVVGANIPVNSGTVLDGFTIKGGNANGSSSLLTISRSKGGGISNEGSFPALINVTISGNSANDHGGGMANSYSSPALTNVTISGNYTGGNGGGMVNSSSSPVLTNVIISGNKAGSSGGGISNDSSSSPLLTDVTISGNSASAKGGGMANFNSSSPVLINVTISGNSTDSSMGGGMSNEGSSPVLTNVTISGNSAGGSGGGMRNEGSSPVLTNVTISGNSSGIDGGGMYNYNSSPKLINVTIAGNKASSGGGIWNGGSPLPQIQNSIIWGNTTGIYNNSSTPEIKYSIVQDSSSTSDGNVADPGSGDAYSPFAGWQDPASVSMPNSDGDYRLGAGSPAVNAGDNSLYPASADVTSVFPSGLSAEAKAAINAALAKDLAGANRKNGTIDMGAYEGQ